MTFWAARNSSEGITIILIFGLVQCKKAHIRMSCMYVYGNRKNKVTCDRNVLIAPCRQEYVCVSWYESILRPWMLFNQYFNAHSHIMVQIRIGSENITSLWFGPPMFRMQFITLSFIPCDIANHNLQPLNRCSFKPPYIATGIAQTSTGIFQPNLNWSSIGKSGSSGMEARYRDGYQDIG